MVITNNFITKNNFLSQKRLVHFSISLSLPCFAKNSAPGGKGKRRRENWQAKPQKAAFAARSG
jgi:hypothetical protein